MASPPEALISSASRRRASSARAASTSFAPRRAASRAVTSPMPDDAPVMTTTCSSNFFSFTPIVDFPPSVCVESLKILRSASAPERAVLDHQAEVLHDLDAGAREPLGDLVVAYAGLEPDRPRLRRENVFEMRRDVLGAPEDVDHVHGAGHVRQFAVDLLPEYLGHLRVVDRHGDDFEPRRGEVLRDVEGGLVRLPLGLDAEHRDAPRLGEQLAEPLVR